MITISLRNKNKEAITATITKKNIHEVAGKSLNIKLKSSTKTVYESMCG